MQKALTLNLSNGLIQNSTNQFIDTTDKPVLMDVINTGNVVLRNNNDFNPFNLEIHNYASHRSRLKLISDSTDGSYADIFLEASGSISIPTNKPRLWAITGQQSGFSTGDTASGVKLVIYGYSADNTYSHAFSVDTHNNVCISHPGGTIGPTGYVHIGKSFGFGLTGSGDLDVAGNMNVDGLFTIGSLTVANRIGINTTPNTETRLHMMGNSSERVRFRMESDGNSQAYNDLDWRVKTPGSIGSTKPIQWIMSMRKDGYFSNDSSGPTLEFFSLLGDNSNYRAPLVFDSKGNVIICSPNNTANAGSVWVGRTSGLTGDGDLDVAGNVRVGASLTLPVKTANYVFVGPTSGADAIPTFRALVQRDIPVLGLNSTAGSTAGSVIFLGSDLALAENNSKLFWDNTNNRLGIGNAAPAQALHVTGTVRASAGLTIDSMTLGSLWFSGTSGALTQDNANLFWDDTNNRLGIGNAAPATALHVTGTGRFSAGITLDTLTAGSVVFAGSSGAISQDNSSLYFDDTNNRLGIGSTAPSGYLHIKYTGGTKIGLQIEDITASGDTIIRLIDPTANINSNSYWLRALSGATDSFYARGDGAIYASGTGAGYTFIDRTGSESWQWYGTGSIARLHNGTRDTISISSAGAINAVVTDAVTNTTSTVQTFWHRSTGTVAANFGTNLVFNLHSDNGTDRSAADTRIFWTTATDASRKARQTFQIYDTAAREYLRGEASGSAAMIGFLGSAASAKQTVTGSRGGNAALASLLTALATYGLITDSSSA